MERLDSTNPRTKAVESNGLLALRKSENSTPVRLHRVKEIGKGVICDTDSRGYAMPNNMSRWEIVLDAPDGVIPLWAKDVTLRWRFQERSLESFENPEAIKGEIKGLFAEAILKWGNAVPIQFKESDEMWDFEIAVRSNDQCTPRGCVLASSFFPDAGRHTLVIYPKMFIQSRKEQVDTLVHELGHVFGLRHFFADISETAWPVEIYGTHSKFTIMNYGPDSELTEADKSDLANLYNQAWRGLLTKINGTPIRLVKPFSMIEAPPVVFVGRLETA